MLSQSFGFFEVLRKRGKRGWTEEADIHVQMVRFSPRAITHLAATEKIIKARGGLAKLPEVMQHLVIM